MQLHFSCHNTKHSSIHLYTCPKGTQQHHILTVLVLHLHLHYSYSSIELWIPIVLVLQLHLPQLHLPQLRQEFYTTPIHSFPPGTHFYTQLCIPTSTPLPPYFYWFRATALNSHLFYHILTPPLFIQTFPLLASFPSTTLSTLLNSS